MRFLRQFTLFLAGCLIGPSVYACTTAGSLIGGFDPTTYVFIGKVSGYAESVKLKHPKALGDISGIEVDVVGRVYLPRESRSFSVVPLRTMADCSPGGFRIEELKTKFPIGSQVRVIAYDGELISQDRNAFRLEAGFVDHTSVSSNYSDDPSLVSSVDSVFDYGALGPDSNNAPPGLYYFVAFEVQKDLVRLEKSQTDLEVRAILKRLEKAPALARIDLSLLRREPIIRLR